MNRTTKRKITKIVKTLTAWEKTAPDAIFAGMTLAQYKEAVAPALNDRDKVLLLLMDLDTTRKALSNNSRLANKVALRVAHAVRADGNYGDNSPLYVSMGYVGADERETGLTRKLKTSEAPAAPAAE